MGLFEHIGVYEVGLKQVAPEMEELTKQVKELVEKEVGDLVPVDAFLKVSVNFCQDTMNLMDENSSKCALYDKFYLEGKK